MLKNLHECAEFEYNGGAETVPSGVEKCPDVHCDSPLPVGAVSAGSPPSREGVSVSENVWFKHWAKKSLGSDDLNSLSDHEERVWWRFLSIASSQEPRWTVRLSVKLTIDAMARSCASTPTKLRSALARFEAMGMLARVDGGWLVANWEKHQETPEAKRKREQRERDKRRDIERDMSQDSHTQEEQRTDTVPNGTVAPKRRRRDPFVALTEDERAILLSENADLEGAAEQIDLATSHEKRFQYPTNQLGYVRNWLRNDRKWHPEKVKAHARQIFKEEGIFAGLD